ncbi:MAG: DUF2779 domain-containing protein [Nitrospira sp.]|nr:DUF2779 domain-containing protein [Nitrospira sp.]
MTHYTPDRPHRLSKSRFLSGLQCQKRLYLEIHDPQLATEPDDRRQSILDMGQEVGQIARRCFPDGVLVAETHRQIPAALEKTAALVADPNVPAIFEGAFQCDGTLIRVDVLERVGQTWRLIEVKASARVKSVHLDDLAVQTYVIRGDGLEVSGTLLMHVNRQYTYPGGDMELEKLFVMEDLTQEVEERIPGIPARLEQMRSTIGHSQVPDVEPDGHCHSPYTCPFWAHCTASKPARWIYHLPGDNRIVHRLRKQGIETIDDIPPQVSLTRVQQCVRDNVEWISPRLADALQSVHYPVHHLDFETFMPAIPLYARTRPYQLLPMQWSNHTEMEDGSLRHTARLCMAQHDPREEIAVSVLESVGEEGSICVYSDSERYILKALADAVPHLRRDLLRVVQRLWDLLPVMQTHYYHPDFHGLFSLKSVLPVLVPSLDYGDLEIRDGATASTMYQKVMFVETDWVESQRVASALHAYCARDTLGMVELRRALSRKAQSADA